MCSYLSGSKIYAFSRIDTLQSILDVALEFWVNLLTTRRLRLINDRLTKHREKLLTNPFGTVTLARPTFFSTSASTPVSGFLIASLLAGQTIPLHCSSSIDAEGEYEGTPES